MNRIKNFREYSVNELMDWVSMPVDVNRGLGDLMNQFYSDFPDLVDNLKNYLGNKFNQFMNSLKNLAEKITMKIGMKDINEMGKQIKSYFGGKPTKKQLESEVTKLVREEFDKSGKDTVKSTQNVFGKLLGSAAILINPIIVRPNIVPVVSDTLKHVSHNLPISSAPATSPFFVITIVLLIIILILAASFSH